MNNNILTKSNINRFAQFILKHINSKSDFDSAYIMSLIFVEYNKLNALALQYKYNLDDDEFAEQFFDLSVYATRKAERKFLIGLRLC